MRAAQGEDGDGSFVPWCSRAKSLNLPAPETLDARPRESGNLFLLLVESAQFDRSEPDPTKSVIDHFESARLAGQYFAEEDLVAAPIELSALTALASCIPCRVFDRRNPQRILPRRPLIHAHWSALSQRLVRTLVVVFSTKSTKSHCCARRFACGGSAVCSCHVK